MPLQSPQPDVSGPLTRLQTAPGGERIQALGYYRSEKEAQIFGLGTQCQAHYGETQHSAEPNVPVATPVLTYEVLKPALVLHGAPKGHLYSHQYCLWSPAIVLTVNMLEHQASIAVWALLLLGSHMCLSPTCIQPCSTEVK